MELHEAILQLKKYQGYLPISEQDGVRKHAFDLTDETVDAILAALSCADEAPSHPSDGAVRVSVAGENESFEDFATAQNDEIDNAAHALLCALSTLRFSREKREGELMGYLGGSPYHAETCPVCGGVMWNGRCEDPGCEIHWHPIDTEDEDSEDEYKSCQ